MTFRSVRGGGRASTSAVPHSEQNFAVGAFSWPQLGQTLTREAYGGLGRGSNKRRRPTRSRSVSDDLARLPVLDRRGRPRAPVRARLVAAHTRSVLCVAAVARFEPARA